jgi:N4-gp56 family major capsid protein
MANTNFSSLLTEEKKVWSRDLWKQARQNSFIMQMAGSGPNAAFQRITELTQSERGTKAVMTMVKDLISDGVTGDSTLEGNEEAIGAQDIEIQIDQLRHANRHAGRMEHQSTIINFRETSRDVLGFWFADRIDQLAALTLSGIDYRMNTNGSIRTGFSHNGTAWARTAPVGQALYDLSFAGDVTAPSADRYFRWDATNGLEKDGNTALTTADTPSYAMLVELNAYAKDRRLRSLKAGGQNLFHVLMPPKAMAKLKLDSDFLANIRNAGPRGNSNPLFSGAIVTVDGLVIHEFPHCFSTLGATAGTSANVGDPGYKWGANADVNGARILMIGAQALAFVDLGAPEWYEDEFDYGNQQAVSTSKIFGFRKPVFDHRQDGDDEDFGVIACDVAI